MHEQNSQIVAIHSLDNQSKKILAISILTQILKKDIKYVTIINTKTCCFACLLKTFPIFAVSLKDLES